MKTTYNTTSKSTNSFAATAFGIAATILLFGGYEATHNDTITEAVMASAFTQQEIVKMDTVVVTAKRIRA
ncbi:MAG: hypothetical protein JNK75_01795 [Betaproteobacteria bacterium]|nr:hypothetical protein [Betaproteobacteria bacterium]